MSRQLAFFVAFLFLILPGVTSSVLRLPSSELSQYRRSHSLNDSYDFDPRDGWTTLNATTLQRATRDDVAALEPKSQKRGFSATVESAFKSIKAIGKAVGVEITWYTGNDLLNPSCWSKSVWTPTDESFVCALTLDGWTTKPQCFSFLELCTGPKKCVYVRVVDTCAGCAAGSKHVDLTRAAFTQLAPVDEGVLTVQMRPATDPTEWFVSLLVLVAIGTDYIGSLGSKNVGPEELNTTLFFACTIL
ncbi:hypothetical protein BT96DRAFT_805277 [Gymnopus androsaceus JB14]|uniref:RlpA-like protein double-psi beta-barrel domain-containing protein n=1 Tax=Gymnopus androsaceus JB14 TaxID=1447944 RepID=A0A6A4IKB9_9AGAR|nr:hypothetical protein BT96DRAFT_805277 [Gymnopus androsaceus JB14]